MAPLLTNPFKSIFLLALFLVQVTHASSAPLGSKSKANHGFISNKSQNDSAHFWDEVYPDPFPTNTLKPQSVIAVRENQFIDESGETFRFIGMNIADPAKLTEDEAWDIRLFKELKNWGANTVRIPIHPAGWRLNGQTWYLERLDEAVRWANELGLYLIIDWHSIGNLDAELFQRPMYETTRSETIQFWRIMALRYQKVPTVAVFELFNEPTDSYFGQGSGSLGEAPWQNWRGCLESLIDLIYAYDDTIIPLVAGFNWAYDLSPVAEHPIRRPGIAYTSHPYPQKASSKALPESELFNRWMQSWGFAAEKYPMILTELGWLKENDYGAHVPVIDQHGNYGQRIVSFMDKHNLSYTVWIFDPDWPPTMIKNWQFEPTEQGAFFKRVMQTNGSSQL